MSDDSGCCCLGCLSTLFCLALAVVSFLVIFVFEWWP